MARKRNIAKRKKVKLKEERVEEEQTHYWDRAFKLLTKASPQDLVSWIVKGAVYEGELSLELLQDAPISADLLYIIRWKGERFVLHIEFQRENDVNMDRRVWEYNCSASRHTGLPVCSVVIYVLNRGTIVEPPYKIHLPTGETVHYFVFKNIKLWEIPKEVLRQQRLPGLLPLLPLTEDGKSQETVEEVIEGLEQANRRDLLPLAYLLAAYTLDMEKEAQWLIERFDKMKGSLEDNYAYREMVKWAEDKAIKRGLEIGLKQGEQQGLLQARKDDIVHFAELRFPELVPLARQQVALATTSQQLQELLYKLYMAHTGSEVQAVLLAL